jgi:hypothetical protein
VLVVIALVALDLELLRRVLEGELLLTDDRRVRPLREPRLLLDEAVAGLELEPELRLRGRRRARERARRRRARGRAACGAGTERVRLTLELGIARYTARRRDAALALLDDVRELMADEVEPALTRRVKRAGSEVDVTSARQRDGADAGGLGRRVVDADVVNGEPKAASMPARTPAGSRRAARARATAWLPLARCAASTRAIASSGRGGTVSSADFRRARRSVSNSVSNPAPIGGVYSRRLPVRPYGLASSSCLPPRKRFLGTRGVPTSMS